MGHQREEEIGDIIDKSIPCSFLGTIRKTSTFPFHQIKESISQLSVSTHRLIRPKFRWKLHIYIPCTFKVPQPRLIEKMKYHGINGNILQWVKAWLTNTKQRVVINGASSEWRIRHKWCPKGFSSWTSTSIILAVKIVLNSKFYWQYQDISSLAKL